MNFKSFDDMSLMLDVKDIQGILRISRGTAYELVNSKDFPSIKVKRRFIISNL